MSRRLYLPVQPQFHRPGATDNQLSWEASVSTSESKAAMRHVNLSALLAGALMVLA